jgi:hypothetical protein
MNDSAMKKVRTIEGDLFWIREKNRSGRKWKWYGSVFNAAGVVQYLTSSGVSLSAIPSGQKGVYEFEGTFRKFQVECLPVDRAVHLNSDEETFRQALLSVSVPYALSHMDSQRKEDSLMEDEEYAEEGEEEW